MIRHALFCAAALGALAGRSAVAQTATPALDVATPHYGTWGFDLTGEDPRVKPGDNFFEFANGTYLARTQIPPDRARFGNFDKLQVLSENRVRAILEQASARPAAAPSTPEQKIGAIYRAFMDEGRIDALGARPMAADLAAVAAAPDRAALARLMGRSPKSFLSSVIDVGIQPDAKNPGRYAVSLSQSGLGLPDRDYYLQPSFAPQKAKYQAYIARLLTLAGWPNPEANAAAVLAFETAVAQASWSKVEQRDPDKTYNPVSLAELQAQAPGFAWRGFLDAADLGGVNRFVVGEKTALPKIAALYASTPLPTLKAWEAFHVADSAAPYLSKPFVDAQFEFRAKTLSGQPEQRARWKRAVAATSRAMGEAVGEVYVDRYFPPESKAKMEALVGDLRTAFAARLQRLDWMSPATKAEALTKLSRYAIKIGYPKRFRDYSTLTVRPDDLHGDMERGVAFEWARQVARLNKPVDREEWEMTPQTVNAYNEPLLNEVVFPAAILQPPFFDPKADPAINYGGIGGVIGHEMTHGFDDQGRKFDADGRLRDWWTPQDAARFDARAKVLGAQYSAIQPLPGAHINGDLTMGENIADLGGLSLALDAYHASLKGRPAPVVGGLTGDQRVFLGWAQVWRGKSRDDALRQQLVADPHSPPEARVNGVVRNIDPWYAAFRVQPSDKLYIAPDRRARIW